MPLKILSMPSLIHTLHSTNSVNLVVSAALKHCKPCPERVHSSEAPTKHQKFISFSLSRLNDQNTPKEIDSRANTHLKEICGP